VPIEEGWGGEKHSLLFFYVYRPGEGIRGWLEAVFFKVKWDLKKVQPG